jgi:tryptophan 2,3-dioxygenase
VKREKLLRQLEEPDMLDYGVYLNCDKLLACQKPVADFVNEDELQFQIVHQVEELWMKLINYSLIHAIGHIEAKNTTRTLTLFTRVHRLCRLMTDQLDLLETMSPKLYQAIRLELGNGSGQESPGFRLMLQTAPEIWTAFESAYLEADGLTVEKVYNSEYDHGPAYMVAEALIEFDELVQIFRARHIFLVQRSIGIDAKSLKGRSLDVLRTGAGSQFFPELWDIRSKMTDEWGGEYGVKRDPIHKPAGTDG